MNSIRTLIQFLEERPDVVEAFCYRWWMVIGSDRIEDIALDCLWFYGLNEFEMPDTIFDYNYAVQLTIMRLNEL